MCSFKIFSIFFFATIFQNLSAANSSGSVMNLVPESEFRLGPDLLAQRRSHDEKICGFQNDTLKAGDNGYLTSPNYPSDYPPKSQCIWWLKVGFTASDNEFWFSTKFVTNHRTSLVCLIVFFTSKQSDWFENWWTFVNTKFRIRCRICWTVSSAIYLSKLHLFLHK